MTGPRFASFTAPSSYWQASRAPRYSLLFALPLLVFYQVLAVRLAAGPRSVRNGADVILQSVFTAVAGRWGPLLFMTCLIGGGLWLVARDARGRGSDAVRLEPAGGGQRRDAARRRHLLSLSLYRALRRPLAALFVPVPPDRRAVLLRAVPAARVRDHRVDARVVRRVAPPAVVNRKQTEQTDTKGNG